MQRRFLDAPAWADYLYQLVEWIDYKASRLISNLTYWRIAFMDRHCKCEKCLQRQRERRCLFPIETVSSNRAHKENK